MGRKSFTEEQIGFALRQADSGTMVPEICRKLGIAEATFYRWRNAYASMSIPEAQRLKELEKENARLKRLLAERMLENDLLKELVEKKG